MNQETMNKLQKDITAIREHLKTVTDADEMEKYYKALEVLKKQLMSDQKMSKELITLREKLKKEYNSKRTKEAKKKAYLKLMEIDKKI